MKPRLRLAVLIPAFVCLSASCSGLGPALGGPTPLPAGNPAALPAAEVIFNVRPPEGTPPDADLALVVLDEVTGLPYNAQPVGMKRLPDGRWQARLTPAVGSLVRYRYTRRAPSPSDEFDTYGMPVRDRVTLVSGPGQQDDIVAAWSDAPYRGPTGRIVGRLRNADTGLPVPEAVLNAGGLSTYSDGEGGFRIDGLPAGVHVLCVYTTDGAYQPVQQGAVVAAQSATPADLALRPATPVQVSFEVSVPADTPPGAPVRIAGNLRQLGNVFADLPGGVSTAAGRMPTLVTVDATHFLLITQLYAGTDLRYKYTLGDGLWNAERDGKGALFTRQVIVPGHELVLSDTVATWHGPSGGSLTFQVTLPATTPPGDQISLQLNPFTWFEPLPMWPLSENTWGYSLYGPLDFGGPLAYRYCRNQQCGAADDADTAGPTAAGRQAKPGTTPQNLTDSVRAWEWLSQPLPPTSVVAPDITARPGFEAGFELIPAYRPSWTAFNTQGLKDMAASGANAVTLTPAWVLQRREPLPVMGFDPTRSPFSDEVRSMAAAAGGLGMKVVLRPTLEPASGSLDDWWRDGERDAAWWSVWFERYRAFAITYARLAAEAGAAKLVLGGPEAAPALPDGRLADGSPSGAPSDAESRWRSLIQEVRAVFPGRLAFEIELGRSLQSPPPFLDAVDEVHVYWHAPLAERLPTSLAEEQAAAVGLIDARLLSLPALAAKPIVLSVEYLSVDGAAGACARAPDESCRPDSLFDFGAIVDPDLKVDLDAQAQAINALLLEVYARPAITGFYVRRYNPIVALQDKSASVNGKPAHDVLWYWYPRLTGK